MDIKTVCLGLLTFGDASGYEIKKLFEDGAFRGVFDASFGSIYPALTRLADDRLVHFREEEQQGRPDKKVYSITEAGRAHFIAELSRGMQPDHVRSEFMIAMIFAHLLPDGIATGYIDQRIEEFRAARTFLQETAQSPDTRLPNMQFAIGLGIATIDAALAYMATNRDLVPHSTPMCDRAPLC